MIVKYPAKIVVACAPGLSDSLAMELESLGLPVIEKDPKAVITEGKYTDVMKLNYLLRTANRVLVHIDSFKADNPDVFYKRAVKIPWEDLILHNGYFSVDSFVKNSNINDTRFANLKMKDAIVDRIKSKMHKRPDTGPDKTKTVIFFRWMENMVDVYYDSSGQTIAKHGYRLNPWKAPLMENLAASLINASKWDGKSHFINPMCGSGTLAIEAALMATGVYPGKLRDDYGFMHIKGYDPRYWKQIRNEIESAGRKTRLDFRIIATDMNRYAIKAARDNARKAGVDHLIDFRYCYFEQTEIPQGNGIVILNPAYGERLGEIEELEKQYKEIGDFFKQKCSGYTGYIFTGNMDLAKKVGLRTKRKLPFFNGKIECRLLEYELYSGTKEYSDK